MTRASHDEVRILPYGSWSGTAPGLRRYDLAASYAISRTVPDSNMTGGACSNNAILLKANPAHRIVVDNFRLIGASKLKYSQRITVSRLP